MSAIRASILVVSILTLLLIGSVQVFASAGSPTTDRPRTDQLPDCITIDVVADGPQVTVSTLRESGASTALVRVVDVQAARWSTSEGHRPKGKQDLSDTGATIVRPVIMEVDQLLGGPTRASRIEGQVLGGQVGCDTTVVEDPIDPKLGTFVAVTLGGAEANTADVPLPIAFLWPVQNNVVHSDTLGDISVDALRTALHSGTP